MKTSLKLALTVILGWNAAAAWAQTPCVDGTADGYPCQGLDLLAVRTLEELGGGANGNDCWGWVDPASGREILLFGRSNGLSVVDVTDPLNPNFLANLPTATVQSLWRDVKVYQNHAFVVSEAAGHGIQIIDLNDVLDIEEGPEELVTVSTYLGFGNAHNIAINEESGFAYGVGTNTAGGGLHAVDISNPASPVAAGTYDGAYTHDAQVVMYDGLDADYAGKEIAVCFNGSNGVALVDVSDKTDMQLISTISYTESAYTHQGWLSEDHRFVFFNDELDEQSFGNGTRTYIADIEDLDNPFVLGYFESDNTAIDHNLYVRGDKIYASNYLSGLRVSQIDENGQLTPYAYFDTNPESDQTSFQGTWSNYPYFPSGTIAVTGFTHVFLLSDPLFEPETPDAVVLPTAPSLEVYPNPAEGMLRVEGMRSVERMRLVNLVGQEVKIWNNLPALGSLVLNIEGVQPGIHLLVGESAAGESVVTRVVVR